MSTSMKRNIQEIYGGGPTGPGSNGNGSNGATLNNNNSNGNHHYHHQQQQQTGQINDPTSNQDAKKSRLEQQPANKQDPSRVVHLRNIPHQLSEQEIVYLGLYFGHIVNVLFLRAKNQAFLEFESLADAQNMIAHFATTSTTFSGKKIFVQYSNHQELNTDPSNASNLAAQNALSDAVQLHRAAREGGKATVLRATILNMLYPVTLDVLTQIFSKFGPIVKMITFNKNDKFQALVQMRDAMAANNAKMALNGQNIYTGCCTLQIDYSKLTNLEVRFNNDKSRDFTNPMLPTGDGTGHNQGGEPGSGNGQMNNNSNGSGGNNMQQPYHHQQQQSLIGNPPGMFGNNNNNSQQSMNPMQNSYGGNQNLGGNVGQMGGHPMMNPNMYQPSQQMNQGGGYGGGGMGPGIMNQQGGGPGMMMGGGQSMNNSQQSGGGQQLPQPGQTSVLLISNLNEECVNTDALFTLFGVYGDVTRVKILFNKKDSALINFANPQQAATALANLDRAKLWNKQIRVFASKHTTVQMPKDGQPDSGLTKDYSTSPLHRFKKPGSKNFNNIFPPSATLHLSNIPPNVTEQQLRELFQKYGQVKAFKFFQKDRKMALIQMGSAEEATHALIASHNYQLADNMHLRCTFSKATV